LRDSEEGGYTLIHYSGELLLFMHSPHFTPRNDRPVDDSTYAPKSMGPDTPEHIVEMESVATDLIDKALNAGQIDERQARLAKLLNKGALMASMRLQ
jgi:hypothetical protein